MLLLCITALTIGTTCNGQVFHANKCTNYLDTIPLLSTSLATFEYSKQENRMIIFFPRTKAVYNDVKYKRKDWGFIITAEDGEYHWYLSDYRTRVTMVVEYPNAGIIDRRVWTMAEFKDLLKIDTFNNIKKT